jgi:hypothetical protein
LWATTSGQGSVSNPASMVPTAQRVVQEGHGICRLEVSEQLCRAQSEPCQAIVLSGCKKHSSNWMDYNFE